MFAKMKKANEIKQMAAVYESLVIAKKITGNEHKPFLRSTKSKYWDKTERAKWEFLKTQDTSFWDKMNNYNHSPIDLANQIYERTMDNLPMASATYLLTGIPAAYGEIVCAGKDFEGKEVITNLNKNIRVLYHITASDILMFITELAKYKQDPLAILGIWQTRDKLSKKWIMALCHEVGWGWVKQYYSSYYDANYNEVIEVNPDEDEDL